MNPLLGRWRIRSTELCRSDELEVNGAATLELEMGSTGRIRMGRLQGDIDWRGRESRSGWRAQFTWAGSLDGRPASGRGWVRMSDRSSLRGKIFIHRGEDPGFRATRL